MPTPCESKDIIYEIRGHVALVTLNRPKALNALTHEMIKTLARWLDEWEDDKNISAVFFQGAGDRAFCAGGDIKHASEQGQAYKRNPDIAISPADYFYDEYSLNRRLFHYPKPLFAFMDGVTMGGGFGIAGPCDHRIATERTTFAMPEVGIGFFPDIGGTYYLRQCPDRIGRYLCLSGNSIGYKEAIYAGIATHYCDSDDITSVMNAVIAAIADGKDGSSLLGSYSGDVTDKGSIAYHKDLIRVCFSGSNVTEIMDCLHGQADPWARELYHIIERRSPLSLEVTMRHIQMGEQGGDSFDAVIERDYKICQHFMEGQDFYEGVRALLIDKDKTPKWQHAALSDVTASDVDVYFSEAERTLP